MKQYEVTKTATLTVEPGSVVFLSEQQAAAASQLLKECEPPKPKGKQSKTE